MGYMPPGGLPRATPECGTESFLGGGGGLPRHLKAVRRSHEGCRWSSLEFRQRLLCVLCRQVVVQVRYCGNVIE